MKNALQRCHRKKYGSVLIVVIAVFAVLAIFLASFMKSATSRTHSTKKIGDTMLARELANSLAMTSFHYIKNVVLKDEGSELRKVLAEPVSFFDNKKVENGDLKEGVKSYIKDGAQDIITALLEKSGLESINLEEMSWRIHNQDFQPLTLNGDKESPYPREKKGIIRVFIKISYKLPGQKDTISEDYLFASSITVSANILPVLSKFNFYVEDAFGNNKPSGDDLLYRFNKVTTSAGGKLRPDTTHCPWIFDNGSNEKVYDSYKDIVLNQKGLIYLGGGDNDSPVILGVARGFSDVEQGPYGEDFHFYKRGSGGYWKTHEVWDNGTGILSANIGLCNDEDTANLGTWQLMFGEGYRKPSTVNSIFRLYGTDSTKQSPTLVLGYVNSMSGDVRAYKGPNNTNNKLAFFDRSEDFINFTALNANDFGESIGATLQYSGSVLSISKFALAYSTRTGLDNSNPSALEEFYEVYKEKYCTKVIQNRYNKDYTYILTKALGRPDEDRAYPIEYCSDVIKDELKSLCELKSNDIFTKVPSVEGAKFDEIYNVKKLDELAPFVDKEKLGIDGSEDSDKKDRIARIVKYDPKGTPLDDFLRFKTLLKKGDDGKERLDLNGWIYVEVEKDGESVIIDKYTSASQGGFIIGGKDGAKANARIKGNIDGEHISIIVLDGDIIIENAVTHLDASLIAANGQVKLECGSTISNNQQLDVMGNIVMKSLTTDMIDNSFKRCLALQYYPSLSALPNNEKSGLSQDELMKTEYPLLMYDLKEDIVMID